MSAAQRREYEPMLQAPVRLSVGQIVRAHLPGLVRSGTFAPAERRALGAMAACKTGTLGGRVEVCSECGVVTPRFFSCRNRHCPGCQTRAQFAWVERRMERVLDVPHFHLVFTLPSELRALARAHPRVVYNALMQAAGETVLAFASDPAHLGALPTVTAVLHTWTRKLTYHPHVHLLVSAGGLELATGAWKSAKQKYLFPVRALSKRMRGAMRADGPDGQNTAPSPTPAGAALGCLHCGTTEPPCVTARWFRGDPPAWPLKGTDTS